MTPDEYRQYEANRQNIIRSNAGRRMSGKPQLPVPPKVERPTRVQLTDRNKDYVGTWPFGVSEADAIAEAQAQGYEGPFKVKYVPA
jgi:hypothetical protein